MSSQHKTRNNSLIMDTLKTKETFYYIYKKLVLRDASDLNSYLTRNLKIAIEDNNIEMVKCIYEKCVLHEDLYLSSHLRIAVENNNMEIVKYIYEKYVLHETPRLSSYLIGSLSIVIKNNNIEMLKYICEKCALHEASHLNSYLIGSLKIAIKNNNIEMLKYIYEKCVLHEAPHLSSYLIGSLITAVENNNMEIVKYIYEKCVLHEAPHLNSYLIRSLRTAVENNNIEILIIIFNLINFDIDITQIPKTTNKLIEYLTHYFLLKYSPRYNVPKIYDLPKDLTKLEINYVINNLLKKSVFDIFINDVINNYNIKFFSDKTDITNLRKKMTKENHKSIKKIIYVKRENMILYRKYKRSIK